MTRVIAGLIVFAVVLGIGYNAGNRGTVYKELPRERITTEVEKIVEVEKVVEIEVMPDSCQKAIHSAETVSGIMQSLLTGTIKARDQIKASRVGYGLGESNARNMEALRDIEDEMAEDSVEFATKKAEYTRYANACKEATE